MKVYVVMSGTNYEGSTLEDICISLETAKKIAEKLATNEHGCIVFTKRDEMNWDRVCDYISIMEWEVKE